MKLVKQRQADLSMDKLQESVKGVLLDRTKTIEERWAALKEYLNKPKTWDDTNQSIDTIDDWANNFNNKVEQTIDTKKAKITEAFREKIWWKSFIFDFVEDAKKEKWFFSIIIVTIWTWLLWDEYKIYKSDISEIWDKLSQVTGKASDVVGDLSNKTIIKVDDLEDKPQIEKTPEEKRNIYYNAWVEFVKRVSKDNSNNLRNFWTITDSLRDKKYSEIKWVEYETLKEKIPNVDKTDFDKTKENLLWNDMKVIYSNVLTDKNIDLLLSKDKTKRILSFMWIENSSWFNWKNLSIENLFSLFAITISYTLLAWVGTIPWIWKNLLSKILEIKSDIPWITELQDELNDSYIDFENNIISAQMVNEIMSKWRINDPASLNWNTQTFESISDQWKIREILNFRDYIVLTIIENDKYNLWYKDKILKATSFRNILELYILFRWKQINDDTIKTSIIYTWIINNLNDWWDDLSYLNKLTEEVTKDKSDILNKNEQEVIKIIIKKFIDKTFLDKLLAEAERVSKVAVSKVEANPEYLAYAAWVIAILRFTPAGRIVSVLYSILWKRWMVILAISSVFAYFYSQLSPQMKDELSEWADYLKNKWEDFDVNALISKINK